MEEHINKGIIDVEVLRKQYPDYLNNAWTLLPDDSAGSFFVIGGNPFENRRHTAKYRENCQEYTGVYGAGMFGSIGVIMPISLP